MNLAQAIAANRVILGVALVLDVCLLIAAFVLLDQESTFADLLHSAGPKGHTLTFLVVLILGVAAANVAALWLVWNDTRKPT